MAEIERTLKPLDVEFDLRFYPGYPPMSVNPDHTWVAEVRGAVERGMGFYAPPFRGAGKPGSGLCHRKDRHSHLRLRGGPADGEQYPRPE